MLQDVRRAPCPSLRIRELPDELLEMIFAAGRTSAYHESSRLHDCRNKFALNVSHVCRVWRIVALASPSLWTLVCGNVEEKDSRPRMAEFMRRANAKPLDLHFNFYNQYDPFLDEDRADLDRLLDVVIPAVDQWISLTVILVTDYSRLHMAERLRSLQVKRLKTLYITLWLPDEDEDGNLLEHELDQATFFEHGAPALQTLRLSSIHWLHCEVSPTPALTTLQMTWFSSNPDTSIEYNDIANLLTSAPALSTLEIYGDMLPMEITDNTSPLLAPALRKLSVSTRLFELCIILSTPALEELDLPHCNPARFERFCNFLSRSKGNAYPALRVLRISLNPELEQARIIVQHTSSIKHVNISVDDSSASHGNRPRPLHLLEAAAEVQGGWPMLETAEVYAADRRCLRNFVASRVSPRTPFKAITMHPTFIHAILNDHSAEYKWISEQGIELREIPEESLYQFNVMAYVRCWEEES
jgi:hypothetical protein